MNTSIVKIIRPLSVITFMSLALSLSSLSVFAEEMDGDDNSDYIGVCSHTAKAALKSCKNAVRDDYWLNVGKCLNESDAADREECLVESKEQRNEDRELCGDQFEARLDICDMLGEAAYDPDIDPANFVDLAGMIATPNPYFPLTPGLVKVYQSGEETITVRVTDQTKEILGVTCVVVRDTVEIDGELIEDTDDWYAQDIDGNVWYFGEISRNYEDGELSDLEGSWKAGEDGAKAGILMFAVPEVGRVYRQEFLLGEAEDMGEVISTSETAASAPAADCSSGCVVTRDFLPIEPDANEYKYFAHGIGHILSIDLESGEREELVEITLP